MKISHNCHILYNVVTKRHLERSPIIGFFFFVICNCTYKTNGKHMQAMYIEVTWLQSLLFFTTKKGVFNMLTIFKILCWPHIKTNQCLITNIIGVSYFTKKNYRSIILVKIVLLCTAFLKIGPVLSPFAYRHLFFSFWQWHSGFNL